MHPMVLIIKRVAVLALALIAATAGWVPRPGAARPGSFGGVLREKNPSGPCRTLLHLPLGRDQTLGRVARR